jgi:hypothetical protein
MISIQSSELNLFGAGALATQLALSLYEKRIPIKHIYSRKYEKASLLASKLASLPISGSIPDFLPKLAFHATSILSITDDAISEFAQQLDSLEGIVIHTAGSVPLLKLKKSQSAVLYPLQTFSYLRTVSFTDIPIFIESSDPKTEQLVYNLASTLSSKVIYANTEQRQTIHLLATITNNFINSLLAHVEQISNSCNIDFQLFRTLAEETIIKAFDILPTKAQTGPAQRGDLYTLEKHRSLISKLSPSFLTLYNLFTSEIEKASQSIQHQLYHYNS